MNKYRYYKDITVAQRMFCPAGGDSEYVWVNQWELWWRQGECHVLVMTCTTVWLQKSDGQLLVWHGAIAWGFSWSLQIIHENTTKCSYAFHSFYVYNTKSFWICNTDTSSCQKGKSGHRNVCMILCIIGC